MAILNASIAFDMQTTAVVDLLNYTDVSFTTSLIRLFDDDTHYVEFSGSGFVPNLAGELVGGTLTGISLVEGTPWLELSRLDVPAADFYNMVAANNRYGTLNLLFSGADAMTGSAQKDVLVGYGGNDTINGGGGWDTLTGLAGKDVLKGGGGNDLLDGGLAADRLTGGSGKDVFQFSSAIAPKANVDVITDFTSGTDKLQLDNDVFLGLPAGVLAAGRLAQGDGLTGGVDAGDRIVHDTATGKLYYDADGSGPTDAILFAKIGVGTELLASDILIVN